MKFIVADYETFFDQKNRYSLKCKEMSTESYVRDPRFEAHGCAIKFGPDLPAKWWNASELKDLYAQIDWSDVFMIHHHAAFDSLIESHHYKVFPRMIGCTLSYARLLLGNHLSVSLDNVRKHFNLPLKTTPYSLFDGKRWSELTPAVQQQIAEGACDEVESIWTIFKLLAKDMPAEELEVVDTTIKMFSMPTLQADVKKLGEIWLDESTKKQDRLVDLNITEADLQSSDRFAQLLRDEGVEPVKKEGKKGLIYAFAKNDPFMEELLEDEDEKIRALAEARIGAKSTLLQTRAETLGFMAQRGSLCVYINYAGAHTSRFSGGDGSNFQNGVPVLNAAILPPPGYILVKPDESQVECRCLNFIAGQQDKVEDFRQGRDPYIGVAESFCGHPVNKTDHPVLRQAGKVVELQAGYGSGGPKIESTLRRFKVPYEPGDGEKWKGAYRNTHPAVTQYWKDAGRMLGRLAGGDPIDWGPFHVREHRIYLPNGVPLIYDTLEHFRDDESGESYWRLKTRKGWVKMYGAKLVENVIQAIARLIVTQAMVRIVRRGYRVVNMRHDDLWVLVPRDGNEKQHIEILLSEMRVVPPYLPGIPLDAEVH